MDIVVTLIEWKSVIIFLGVLLGLGYIWTLNTTFRKGTKNLITIGILVALLGLYVTNTLSIGGGPCGACTVDMSASEKYWCQKAEDAGCLQVQ